VGAVDNGGALIMPFIESYGGGRWAVKGREVMAMKLQLHRLREMEMGKERRWGANVFGGEEREEVRWLHGARDGRHSKERCSSQGGRRRRLASRSRR
jgi:hypothetical protein